jgi:hypothetical protein
MEVHQCECAVCQRGEDEAVIAHHRHINLVLSRLAEAERRWYVASLSSGREGSSGAVLAQISGLSEKTIARGRRELDGDLSEIEGARQRRRGGGRPRAEKKTRR